jgi:hypothetical protein
VANVIWLILAIDQNAGFLCRNAGSLATLPGDLSPDFQLQLNSHLTLSDTDFLL